MRYSRLPLPLDDPVQLHAARVPDVSRCLHDLLVPRWQTEMRVQEAMESSGHADVLLQHDLSNITAECTERNQTASLGHCTLE